MAPLLENPCQVSLRALDGGDEPIRWAGQGFDDIPALLSGGGDDAAQDGEVLGPCADRKPPEIFWRSFIIRRSRSASLFVNPTSRSIRNRSTAHLWVAQPQGRIVTDPSLPALLPLARRERWLALVKGQRIGDDLVVSALDQRHKPRRNGDILVQRDAGGAIGSAQELLHPPGPSLPFDVHQRLQLPQVMGVAQAVLHPFHREVRLPVIVHDDAGDTREQGAALAADPVRRQQRRADHMKPLRLTADPQAGLVHVFHPRRARRQVLYVQGRVPHSRSAALSLIVANVAAVTGRPKSSAITCDSRSSGRK